MRTLTLNFVFFFISSPAFCLKHTAIPSFLTKGKTCLTTIALHILPFLLNLNLYPLYPTRGGCITLTEPFKKKPTEVDLLQKPLYK